MFSRDSEQKIKNRRKKRTVTLTPLPTINSLATPLQYDFNIFLQPSGLLYLSGVYIYTVMQSDGNSCKFDTFLDAITSELMISS